MLEKLENCISLWKVLIPIVEKLTYRCMYIVIKKLLLVLVPSMNITFWWEVIGYVLLNEEVRGELMMDSCKASA